MQKKQYSFKKGIPNEYKILFSTRFVTKKIIDYDVLLKIRNNLYNKF